MESLPEFPESELRTLTLLFLLKFDERITALENDDEYQDKSDAYRDALAETNPLIAKRFEQMTKEQRQEAIKNLAIAESVAYLVRYALDNSSQYFPIDKNE